MTRLTQLLPHGVPFAGANVVLAPMLVILSLVCGSARVQADLSVSSSAVSDAQEQFYAQSTKDDQTTEPVAENYQPLVRSSTLFPGFDGAALDLDLNLDASMHCIVGQSGREATDLSGKTHIRFDLVPEQERLYVLRVSRKGTALYNLSIISSNVAFNDNGTLINAELPEELDHKQVVIQSATLEVLLWLLAKDEQQLLQRLNGQEHALLNITREQAELTVYSEQPLLQPLFSVALDKSSHHQIVVHDPNWVQRSTVDRDFDYPGGSLKLTALVESYKGSVSEVALHALEGIVMPHLDKLGQVGEVGLNSDLFFRKPEVWQVSLMDMSDLKEPFYRLSGTVDPEKIVSAMDSVFNWAESRGMEPKLILDDDFSMDSISREWLNYGQLDPSRVTQYHSLGINELFDRGILVRASNLAPGVRYHRFHYGEPFWLLRYLSNHSIAVIGGMIVGGAAKAGIDIYNDYQRTGRWPHKYTPEEREVLIQRTSAAVLRGGLNASVSFNLTKGLGVPAVVAGAVIGMGNSLYDSYQQGLLNRRNYGCVAIRAGAESTMAAAGSLIGAKLVGSATSWTFGSTTGALAGSLFGHYLYNYVENNYGSIKQSFNNSVESLGNRLHDFRVSATGLEPVEYW